MMNNLKIDKAKLSKANEDYLEAILILKNKNGYVRNVDIAEHMGYSKPSITHAITVLRKGGYVTTDTDKNIFLTTKGEKVAEKIYAKHEFFRKHLITIGVDEERATKDACRLEHAISDESFKKLKQSILEK